MSNRITNVSAVLSTTDLTFSSGLRRAREDLARTASAAEQIQAQTSRLDMWGGLLPTFDVGNLLSQAMGNVGRIFDEIENGLKRIEQRSDAGEVLGFTYQQMQALEVAATVADMPVDRLSQTFGRLLKSVAMAGQGSKEARKDLERLGLTVKDLEGMTAWQVIGLVADRLSEITSPADRAAAAIELFGREAGLKMTQVLGGGADAMERYMATAKSLGLFLEDEMVQAAKLAGDAADLQALRMRASLDRQAAKVADLAAEWQYLKASALEPALALLSGLNRASDELGASLAAMFRTSGRGSTVLEDAALTRKYTEESLAGLQSRGGGSGQWPTTMNDLPALVEAEDQAKKLEGIYDQIEQEQKQSAERIAAWRAKVREQELADYYREWGETVRKTQAEQQKAEEQSRRQTLEAERATQRTREDAARDLEAAWASGQSGGAATASLAMKGSAQAQLAMYNASRQDSMQQAKDQFIIDGVRRVLESVVVKVNGGTSISVVPI
jgi:hypothetical protein